jgi:hypothetical protein
MKTGFKITLTMLMLGWLVFAFLAAWGSHQEVITRSVIALIGFFFCFTGTFMTFVFMNNNGWWDTHAQLQEKIKQAETNIDNAIRMKSILFSRYMKEDVDKDFVNDALNFYWNDAHKQLQRTDLGDIERKNYEFQLSESKRIMDGRTREQITLRAINE